MAIAFIKKRKRQKYLGLIAVVVVVGSLIILWYGYFRKEKQPLPTPAVSGPYREIKVDFGILENPLLKEFQPFEKISPFEGETGRENPFLPY